MSRHGWPPDRRIAAALVAIGLVIVAWQLVGVWLLVFASVLIGVLLRAAAGLLRRWTGLPHAWALAVVGLGTALLIAGGVFVFGSQVSAQIAELAQRLPETWALLEERLSDSRVGAMIISRLAHLQESGAGAVLARVAGALATAGAGLLDLLLVVLAGIYLAAQPKLYRRGIILLFPRPRRRQARETLDAVGRALKAWLVGQLVAMVIVGIITGTGLALIGVPSPLALGLAAALLEFVPIVGPILAAAPALLMASTQGLDILLLTLGLYVLVQQLEGNVVTPIVLQEAVSLPPAVTIFAVVAFGTLFGLIGVLLAAPLTVLLFVLVTKLWVEGYLHERVRLPGER